MSPEYPHILTRKPLSTSVIAAHPASVEGAPNGTPVSASMVAPMLASCPVRGDVDAGVSPAVRGGRCLAPALSGPSRDSSTP